MIAVQGVVGGNRFMLLSNVLDTKGEDVGGVCFCITMLKFT